MRSSDLLPVTSGQELLELRSYGFQDVFPGSQYTAHGMLPAIEQVLSFENEPSPPSSHVPKRIFNVCTQPLTRFISRLRREQNC